MRRTIAVDFDGCICESKWPEIGEPRQEVINELIRAQAEGSRLILWTCREGELLDAAIMWCLNRGLRFDAVNDNLDENKRLFGNNCRKVWADEYWDDKSVLVMGQGMITRITIYKPSGSRTVELECIDAAQREGLRKKLKRWLVRLREIMRLPEP